MYGREFPAHRCVLAACSPWFETRFKVHKALKEVIEVENCKNYEVFHLVLTYMYSGWLGILLISIFLSVSDPDPGILTGWDPDPV